MTGKECKNHCHTIATQTEGTNDLTFEPPIATAVYGVQFPDILLPNRPTNITWTDSTLPSQQEYDDYFEMRTEKEIRQLLNEIFLWLSGMGEYPELLAQICPEEIVGYTDTEDEDEKMKLRERTVAQVLRWVLGEL